MVVKLWKYKAHLHVFAFSWTACHTSILPLDDLRRWRLIVTHALYACSQQNQLITSCSLVKWLKLLEDHRWVSLGVLGYFLALFLVWWKLGILLWGRLGIVFC